MKIEFNGEDRQKTPKSSQVSIKDFSSERGRTFWMVSGITQSSIPEIGESGVLFVPKQIGGMDIWPQEAQQLAEGFSLCDKQENGRDVCIVPRPVKSQKRGSALMPLGLAFPLLKKGSSEVLGYSCEGVKFFNNKEKDGQMPVLTPKACFELLDNGETTSEDRVLELANVKTSIWKNQEGMEFTQQEAMYRIKKKSIDHDKTPKIKLGMDFGTFG